MLLTNVTPIYLTKKNFFNDSLNVLMYLSSKSLNVLLDKYCDPAPLINSFLGC